MDYPYDNLERQLREKFGEANLEKVTSTNSSLQGVKKSQDAKRVRKSKKQLAKPSNENLYTEDFVGTMVGGEEGATQDRMVKAPMT
jgi:hypothetical protein